MRRAALFVAVLSCLVAGKAVAMTGNELWDHCLKDTHFDQGYCHGYIEGAFDGALSQLSCLPRDLTVGQAGAVVKIYLEGHPQLRHMNAQKLIYRVLSEAWPCK